MVAPSGSTISTCSSSQSSALRFLMSERTAEIWPTRSKSLAHLVDGPRRPARRRPSSSSSRSSSVHSMPSASATARSARSTLTACGGGLAQLLAERLGLGAGHGEVLLELHALGLEAHGEVLEPLLHLAGRPAARGARRRPARPAPRPPSRAAPSGPGPCGPASCGRRGSARSSATVSNSEASEAHSSVTSGSTFSLTSLTSDARTGAGAPRRGRGGWRRTRGCRRPWRRAAARRPRGRWRRSRPRSCSRRR